MSDLKIFAKTIEDSARKQVNDLANHPAFPDSRIRIMPDVHAGMGCTIGTTMTITDKVVPGMVGVDIGCGMLVTKLKEKDLDLPMLDAIIHEFIPAGMDVHKNVPLEAMLIRFDQLKCRHHVDIDRAMKSVGTLGGGNHFIEVDVDGDGNYYLVVHSGSRNIGKQVAEYYQDLAYEQTFSSKDRIAQVIKALKETGQEKEIASAIAAIKKSTPSVPKDQAWVEGDLFKDYLHDMRFMQGYASYNRTVISAEILTRMSWNEEETFETIHNYIDTDEMILRKGAVAAHEGEKLLIPINMSDGSLICVGKGNPDWNFSAPHGAGRLMSRSKARETLSIKQFEREMVGIYTSCVNMNTIDESPMAYKPMAEIMEQIQPTVDIQAVIRPVYNFKAGQ